MRRPILGRVQQASSTRTHATVVPQYNHRSIKVGILLKRDPIITPPPDEFSYAYLNYRHTLENAHSRPFPYEFYFKRGSLQEQRWLDAIGKDGQPHSASSDALDTFRQHELNNIKVAPARTIADQNNDTMSLDRALDRTLYLLVYGDRRWRLPEGSLQADELLHQAASRELETQCGNSLETWFVGSIPVGHLTRSSPSSTETVFYIKAHILAGQIHDKSQYAWLTKEEILAKLDATDASQVSDMLSTRHVQLGRIYHLARYLKSSPDFTVPVFKHQSKIKMAKALYVFEKNSEISEALNAWVSGLSEAAIAKSGRFTVAVSGGSLPSILGAKLATNSSVDWSTWHVFFADERCVRHDSPDSNYDLARKHLFSKVPIPASNIHPINEALISDPEAAADDYARTLNSLFFAASGSNTTKQLLDEHSRIVSSLSDSPKPPPTRITLTYPVVNAASTVAFVATGESKAAALHKIFDEDEPLPSGRVKPGSGELYWFLDKPAVKSLLAKTDKFKL
ncbi:glucosamine-6-phosphate deaminase [Synchytrium endobioticum]|uniref:Glucosamine-6-phosphate deaminase n=1 Tax=Synchytrium endobioticum TaxID=286115 RepID=A0A507D6X5_9FUNG|nr:glucosamine-6-phosphate deaminase [Synchytrium endobioticum]